MHRSKVGLFSLGIALTFGAISHASIANSNDEEFGRGLTAFHEGQMERAVDIFSGLIENDTTDPRPFYFRGLVYLRAGRPEQAEADFAAGAKLEANNNIRAYPVNKSLQFVQGSDRLKLEAFRDKAQQQRKDMRQRVLELRYQSGDAQPLPDPNEFARPEVTEVADSTMPSLTLAPLDVEQITATNLTDLPPVNATAALLTQGSSQVSIPSMVKLDADPRGRTGSINSGAGGGSDPFATGGSAGGASSDPFATGGSGGASDPFKSGGGNSGGGNASDPFATGNDDKGGEKKDDPFGSSGNSGSGNSGSGGSDPNDPFGG